MSDNTELIWLIQHRNELNEKDFEKYFNIINKVIKRTGKFLKLKYNTLDLMNTSSIITEEDFLNLCWDTLEGTEDNDKRLIDLLQTLEFPDDKNLKAYLGKTFERLFLDTLYKMFPEFQTRTKQVGRVMKPLCIRTKGEESSLKGDLWQLKEYDTLPVSILTLDKLKDCAAAVFIPEITYPKLENAQRGASIKDDDMKNYILEILRSAGGAVYKKDLDGLIAYLFCSNQIFSATLDFNNKNDTNDNKRVSQESITDIPCATDLVMPACCYTIMAQQCISSMDEQMEEILYYIYVKELEQGLVAKKMGKSAGSITKIKQKAEKHISDYIQNDASEFSYQEGKILFELIIELISEKRQVSL